MKLERLGFVSLYWGMLCIKNTYPLVERILARLLLVACWGLLGGNFEIRAVDYQVFVGSYTDGASRGIYSFKFNSTTGIAGSPRLVAESENPSFLAIHGSGKFLYAVNETNEYENKASGAVSAYRIHEDGSLKLLNRVASGGAAPCHLVVDSAGKTLLLANYNGGNVAAFRLGEDGSIGERSILIQHLGSSINRRRQNEPHAHSINLDSGNRFAVAADLGVDKLFVYPFDEESGELQLAEANSLSLPAGAGPRHFAFHPQGELAFVNNELHSSLSSLRYKPLEGRLEMIESVSTLPRDFGGGNSTAETQVHPNGKSVYVSNRGHNSIAVFSVNQRSGQLRLLEHESTQGKTPRNFCLSPEGDFLLAANQGSDSIVIFRVDSNSGRLESTGESLNVPKPVCIRFLRLN